MLQSGLPVSGGLAVGATMGEPIGARAVFFCSADFSAIAVSMSSWGDELNLNGGNLDRAIATTPTHDASYGSRSGWSDPA